MKVENFLAMPGMPCVRVRVGPGPGDFADIDQAYLDAHMEEVRDYCESLGEVTASNWRTLRVHTEDNGMMAKLLIVLGDLAGAWSMYPPIDSGQGLWNRDHPRIFQLTTPVKSIRRVPKPSAGDIDADSSCSCCQRGMGTFNSHVHDIVASKAEPELCIECYLADCYVGEGACNVFPGRDRNDPKQGPARVEADVEVETGPPPGMASYLNQFK